MPRRRSSSPTGDCARNIWACRDLRDWMLVLESACERRRSKARVRAHRGRPHWTYARVSARRIGLGGAGEVVCEENRGRYEQTGAELLAIRLLTVDKVL